MVYPRHESTTPPLRRSPREELSFHRTEGRIGRSRLHSGLASAMATTHSSRGYVVSDLHLFSRASLYQPFMPLLRKAVIEHSAVVLNGDTFDFKRSPFTSPEETIRHALDWLADLCGSAPKTSMYYLIGNHDSNPLFVSALTERASSIPNLTIAPEILQLGSNLFLHGDACDLPAGEKDISTVRRRYASPARSLSSVACASIVTHLRLNIVEYIRHSRRHLAERILTYLDMTYPQYASSVTTVFFGHTHVPFSNFEHKGILFNNTGSLIRGLRMMPMEFDY